MDLLRDWDGPLLFLLWLVLLLIIVSIIDGGPEQIKEQRFALAICVGILAFTIYLIL